MSDEENRIDSAFHRLLGRAPTHEEKVRLYKVEDALGLDPNDSLWLVLMALDYYVCLYREIPKQLAGAAEPLRELGRAPEIVQALEEATAATAKARGLWTTLSVRGLSWGLALGLALGLAIGTMFGLVAVRDLWVGYQQWNLENQVVAMEKQRAEIGAAYAALKGWNHRGLVVTPTVIVVDKTGDIVAGDSTSGKVAGIWIRP